MNLNETKAILKDIALIDNRKLDEAVAQAWHAIIGQMEFEVAKEALKLARQDASIGYLEPKHLVAWGKEASHRLNRNRVPEDVAQTGYAPEPTCKAHGLRITTCDTCCRAVAQMADSWNMFEVPSAKNGWHDAMWKNTDKLHQWAKQNIYA